MQTCVFLLLTLMQQTITATSRCVCVCLCTVCVECFLFISDLICFCVWVIWLCVCFFASEDIWWTFCSFSCLTLESTGIVFHVIHSSNSHCIPGVCMCTVTLIFCKWSQLFDIFTNRELWRSDWGIIRAFSEALHYSTHILQNESIWLEEFCVKT